MPGSCPFTRDEQLGLTRQFAAALTDHHQVGYIDHTFLEMTRARVYGIMADYANQNDNDVLRSDPIFRLICGRAVSGRDLASQPTLSRFENAIATALLALQDLLLDQFIAAFDKPPTHLTLDIDPFDDPTHGQQQLTFFHGYYQQYQYLPRAITCAENDLVLCVCLLHGTAHPTLGIPTIWNTSCGVCVRTGRACGFTSVATAALAPPPCTRSASGWRFSTPSAWP